MARMVNVCRKLILRVQSAVAQAQAFAGDKDVSLTAGNLVRQALRAGLVDELRIDLVPVVFGSGVRYFRQLRRVDPVARSPGDRPRRPRNASALSNTKVMIMHSAMDLPVAS